IHSAANRVRYRINTFVICVGSYVVPLSDEAIETASRMGEIYIDMNGTSCKVPEAIGYINKAKERGSLGKKKKTVKC
ncbi:MAG TPA: hypothetical protein VIM77_10995, partial [Mucilaginibacter sp.]